MTIRRRVRRRRGPNKPAEERKDHLIQARVPRDLDEVLKQDAKRQRLSVSHLIRNVLQDAYELVDGVIGDVDQIVQDSVKLSGRVTRDARHLARTAAGLRDHASDAHEAPRSARRHEAPAAERQSEVPLDSLHQAPSSVSRRQQPSAERRHAPAPESRREAPTEEEPLSEAGVSSAFDVRTADVYAWQAVVLNRAARCERCERTLARGETTHLGLSQIASQAPRWLCPDCLALLADC